MTSVIDQQGTILWRVQPDHGDLVVKDPESGPLEPGDLTFVQAGYYDYDYSC